MREATIDPWSRLRSSGWVFLHHQEGEFASVRRSTCWFVHSSGRWIRGDGDSYDAALVHAADAAEALGVVNPDDLAVAGDPRKWLDEAVGNQRRLDHWFATSSGRRPDGVLGMVWDAAQDVFVQALFGWILTDRVMGRPVDREVARRVFEIRDHIALLGVRDHRGKGLVGPRLLERMRPIPVPDAAGEDPSDVLAAFWDVVEEAGLGDRRSENHVGRVARVDAFLRHQATEAWRPIATAPRAGDPQSDVPDVDLWHRSEGRRVGCFWWEERRAWFMRHGGRASNAGTDEDFTHWRPEPPGPPGSIPAS